MRGTIRRDGIRVVLASLVFDGKCTLFYSIRDPTDNTIKIQRIPSLIIRVRLRVPGHNIHNFFVVVVVLVVVLVRGFSLGIGQKF